MFNLLPYVICREIIARKILLEFGATSDTKKSFALYLHKFLYLQCSTLEISGRVKSHSLQSRSVVNKNKKELFSLITIYFCILLIQYK